MKKLFVASLFLFLSGCATVPKETKIETSQPKTVCNMASEYVESLDAYFTSTKKPVKAKLEYCTELRGHIAYFTYSMLTDTNDLKAASEVHFFAMLKNIEGEWVIIKEEPFVGDISPELKERMRSEEKHTETL